MSASTAQRARAWAWWLAPAIALAALIAWEIDWGRNVLPVPAAPPAVDPKPVESSVLPEYRIEGGLVAHSETLNRTLFNPTRRPAPALAGDGSGSQRFQRGQFLLVGTAVAGEHNIAFLREVNGGKPHAVRQGDEINGMRVALVTADRIRLTLGDDAEDLMLKVAHGPKTTLGNAPAPAAAINPVPAVPRQTAAAPGAAQPAAPTPPDAALSRAAQRRANRRGVEAGQDGAAAGSDATPGTFGPPPPAAAAAVGPPANAPAPGTWAGTYQNMQQQAPH